MYSIGCIRKNGSLLKLASVSDENSRIENFINFNNNNLNQLNNEIVEFIISNANMEVLEKEILFNCGKYNLIINHIFTTRKYKLYFFTQIYNNKKKYICYYSDRVIHQGFGEEIPSRDEIIKLMILVYIKNPSLLMNKDIDKYNRIVSTIESNFGF